MDQTELQLSLTRLVQCYPQMFTDIDLIYVVLAAPGTLGLFGVCNDKNMWEYIHTQEDSRYPSRPYIYGFPPAACREIVRQVSFPFALESRRTWSFVVHPPSFHEIANRLSEEDDQS